MEELNKCSILELNKKFKENVIVCFDKTSNYILESEKRRNNFIETFDSIEKSISNSLNIKKKLTDHRSSNKEYLKSNNNLSIENENFEKYNYLIDRSHSNVDGRTSKLNIGNKSELNKNFISIKLKSNLSCNKFSNSKCYESDIILTTNSNSDKNAQIQNKTNEYKDYLNDVRQREKKIYDLFSKINELKKDSNININKNKCKEKFYNNDLNKKKIQNIIESESSNKFSNHILEKCNYNTEQILPTKSKNDKDNNESCIII